jgi:hypothetical protein
MAAAQDEVKETALKIAKARRRIASLATQIEAPTVRFVVSDGEIGSVPPVPRSPEAAIEHERIAQAAYYRAESRGFAPGHELEDWLAAEKLIRQIRY